MNVARCVGWMGWGASEAKEHPISSHVQIHTRFIKAFQNRTAVRSCSLGGSFYISAGGQDRSVCSYSYYLSLRLFIRHRADIVTSLARVE